MTAPARHASALRSHHAFPAHHWRPPARRPEYWRRAAEIRREWLDIGLSTEPADRSTTEEAIASIYARHRRARPTFRWVESPCAALPHLTGLPTHETLRSWVDTRRPPGRPPIASDIAAGLSRLRSRLAEGVTEPAADRPLMKRAKDKPWPLLPPDAALDAGLPFVELLRQGIRDSLHRSLARGIYLPIRAALATHLPPAVSRAAAVSRLPVGWYGNQDAPWIGHLEALRRLGLAAGGHGAEFDAWVALARAGGWWWPGERHCVVVDRPAVIRAEPIPGAWHGEVRPVRDTGRPVRDAGRPIRDTVKPAVEYRDGWSI